jgi:hypothetical protein
MALGNPGRKCHLFFVRLFLRTPGFFNDGPVNSNKGETNHSYMNHRVNSVGIYFTLWSLMVAATAWFIVSPFPAMGQPATSAPPPVASAPAPQSAPPPVTPPPSPGKDTWDRWNVIAAIVSAIGTMAAAAAAVWSFKTAKQSENTAKAQRLSDLWPDLQKLKYLSEEQLTRLNDQDVADIVRNNLNAMEKIGLWWHASLIDRAILAQELGTGYLALYDQIKGLGQLEKLNRTGAELIQENPFVTELYLELPGYIAAQSLNQKHSQS